jgi:hypothetical protein
MENPELRRQWVEDYLERKKRKGRTDVDIAGEVLELALKVADVMARGRWANVAESAITSGELRKTVEAAVIALSAKSSGPANPTHPQTTASPLRHHQSNIPQQRRPRTRREDVARIISAPLPPVEELVRLASAQADQSNAEASTDDHPPTDGHGVEVVVEDASQQDANGRDS